MSHVCKVSFFDSRQVIWAHVHSVNYGAISSETCPRNSRKECAETHFESVNTVYSILLYPLNIKVNKFMFICPDLNTDSNIYTLRCQKPERTRSMFVVLEKGTSSAVKLRENWFPNLKLEPRRRLTQ